MNSALVRKIPLMVVAVVIGVSLLRVASYSADVMRAGALSGWLIAAALGVDVYISAYFMRVSGERNGEETKASRRVRTTAMVCFAIGVVFDGYFNVLEVLRSAVTTTDAQAVSAYFYGLLPTVFAGSLGVLQGYIDRLPAPPPKAAKTRRAQLVSRIIEGWLGRFAERAENVQPNPAPITTQAPAAAHKSNAGRKPLAHTTPPANADGKVYTCGVCGYATTNRYIFSGHANKHKSAS